jgi:hypothetical protein
VGVGGPCGHHGRAPLAQGAPGAPYRLDGNVMNPGQPVKTTYKVAEQAFQMVPFPMRAWYCVS